MKRRGVIASLGVIGTGLISGCSGITGPDPEVVDTETEAGLGSLVGLFTVHVTVVNNGAAGDVVVTLEILDASETVLDKYTKEVSMEQDERRRVTFEVRVSEDADSYRAEAEPA